LSLRSSLLVTPWQTTVQLMHLHIQNPYNTYTSCIHHHRWLRTHGQNKVSYKTQQSEKIVCGSTHSQTRCSQEETRPQLDSPQIPQELPSALRLFHTLISFSFDRSHDNFGALDKIVAAQHCPHFAYSLPHEAK
jgi:uncharacterized CHY-type Zn-finger protein